MIQDNRDFIAIKLRNAEAGSITTVSTLEIRQILKENGIERRGNASELWFYDVTSSSTD